MCVEHVIASLACYLSPIPLGGFARRISVEPDPKLAPSTGPIRDPAPINTDMVWGSERRGWFSLLGRTLFRCCSDTLDKSLSPQRQ